MDSSYDSLVPRLRLFLSADISGSTRFKYESGHDQRWARITEEFYATFQFKFLQAWKNRLSYIPGDGRFQDACAEWALDSTQSEPSLWKAMGDELVFSKILLGPIEAVAAVLAFRDTLSKYDRVLNGDFKTLGVKGAAWLAGFPIKNREIALERRIEALPLGDGSYEYLLKNSKESLEGSTLYTRDFVGPSMDIGFRLAAKASRRKFMISADLAWMITHIQNKHTLNVIQFFCDDEESLKGVLKSKSYPQTWIDIRTGIEDSLEDKVTQRSAAPSKSILEEYLTAYISSQAPDLKFPYIRKDGNNIFGEIPESDLELLTTLLNQAVPLSDYEGSSATEVDLNGDPDAELPDMRQPEID